MHDLFRKSSYLVRPLSAPIDWLAAHGIGQARKRPYDPVALRPGKLKVIMDISNKCNLRCIMCHFSFDRVFYRPAEYMSSANFAHVAKQVFPYAHAVVLSAGSEPTVSPHFEDILRIASQWHLPELKFLTNGTRFTERMIEAILDAGVTQIDVSIDGACASTYEKIRQGGNFERLVRNLKLLRDRKRERGTPLPLVQFNVTLMRSNLYELDRFVDLAEECGIERIGCRHVMPYAGLNIADESLFAIQVEANQAFEQFIKRIERSASVRLITFPDFFSLPGESTDALPQPSAEEAVAARLNDGSIRLNDRGADPPFGYVDLPEAGPVIAASTVHMAGWALDREGIECIVVACWNRASRRWQVLRVAKRVNGSRPDVAARFPEYPECSGAGWVCDLQAEQLPAQAAKKAVELSVIAINRRGFWSVIGKRKMRLPAPDPTATHAAMPFMFCQKPFNSIYVDANGDVYPYPDCRPERPSGNLLNGESFADIWHGTEQRLLREAILAQLPPAMCRTCPNFINRCADDGAFHEERQVVERYVDLPIRVRRKSGESQRR